MSKSIDENIIVIDYYKSLFEELNSKVNEQINSKEELLYFEYFSFIVLGRNIDEDGYSWILNRNQEDFVKKILSKYFVGKIFGKKLHDNNFNDFFESWIKFRFKTSGLISYFNQTGKEIEILENVEHEKYLINKQVYKYDYELPVNKTLKEKLFDYKSGIDPFYELESIWANTRFTDPGSSIAISFVYFRLPTNKFSKLDLVGVLPFCFEDHTRENKLLSIKYLISDIQSAVYGASLMHRVMREKAIELRTETIKSAVTAIMARNMSHNLGSHVLSHTKKRIDDLLQRDLNAAANPALRGIKRLLHYLQERQDFISVIASNEKYGLGPVNLKAAIFDEIAVDGLSHRHKTENVENHLLNYIVKSEHFTREGDWKSDSDHDIELRLAWEEDGEVIFFESLNSETQVSDTFKYFNIAIPFGLNGRQAIFSILENIIRNAAKHDKDALAIVGKLLITLKIKRNPDKQGYFQVTIYDNKNNARKKSLIQTKGDFLISFLRNQLNTLTILDRDGKLDKNNKGLKEVLICIGWLLQQEPDAVLAKRKDYLRLEIVDDNGSVLSDDPNESLDVGHLAYVFNLPEYLSGAVVTDKEQAKNQNAGVLVTDNTDLAKWLKKSYTRVALVTDKSVLAKVKHNNTVPDNIWREVIRRNTGIDPDILKLVIVDSDTRTDSKNIRYFSDDNEFKRQKSLLEAPFILYRNHNDTPQQFIDFKKDYRSEVFENENCLFIEGISGGNFTQNLIRKNDISIEEFYKIVEAALTKIVLIDERLFAKYDGVKNQGHLSQQLEEIERIIKTGGTPTEVRELLIPYLGVTAEKLSYTDIKRLMAEKGEPENLRQLTQVLVEEQQRHPGSNKERYKSEFLQKKNIFIYDFDENYNLLFDLDGMPYNLNLTSGIQPHFVSIHLGLLEKYNEKNNLNISDISYSENNIFEALKRMFGGEVKISIHSGRGGLSNENYKYPFIPLSGLDWALDNCKYLLTETFYGTKYDL